jgi:hypothetical protein
MKYRVYKAIEGRPGVVDLTEVDSLEAGIEWLANEYKDRVLVLGEIDREVSPPAYDAFYESDGYDSGLIVGVQAKEYVLV